MSTVGSSLRKVNTGAQLQTFPYPTASKSFLYSSAYMAKTGAQSLTFKSVTDRQTNRQTEKTRNREHRRTAAKPAACTKTLMPLTVGSKGKRKGG